MKLDIVFGLKLKYLIVSVSEQFSCNLQAKDTTIQEGTQRAKLLVSHCKLLRVESKFDIFYDNILELSSGFTEVSLGVVEDLGNWIMEKIHMLSVGS